MNTPNEQHREEMAKSQNPANEDALTLDKETLKDLEAPAEGSETVKGGVGTSDLCLTRVRATDMCFTPNPS